MSEHVNKSIFSKLSTYADGLIKPVNDRMSNALTGSFILSAIALNWKTILYLFMSKTTIAESYKYIDENIYQHKFEELSMFVIYPALISLFYNFLIPPMTDLMERLSHTYRLGNQKRSQNLESARLLHNIEVQGLLAQAERQKIEFDNLKDFTAKIQELNTEIESKNQDIKELTEKFSEHTRKINEDALKHTEVIENLMELQTQNDRLKVGLKGILTKSLLDSNDNSLNNSLYRLIENLELPDISFKHELYEILTQYSNDTFKITINHDENFNFDQLFEVFKLYRYDIEIIKSTAHQHILTVKSTDIKIMSELKNSIQKTFNSVQVIIDKFYEQN